VSQRVQEPPRSTVPAVDLSVTLWLCARQAVPIVANVQVPQLTA
jgi:hypothetical protein